MFELKENSGNLFRNDKGDNEKRPDYRGEIKVDGVLYSLSAWIRDGAKGKFMSLSLTPKEEQAKPAPKAKQVTSVADLEDDDLDSVPF